MEDLINPKEKNKMAFRQKQQVLAKAYEHFKEFELPLDIDYKSYVDIVGARDAIHPISVKRSFKAWKYVLHSLKTRHKDLSVKPVIVPTPPPPAEDPLATLGKAANKAEKEMNDE